VQLVQAALKDAGYYGGSVDGIAGSDTTAAITAFEKTTGRAVTGPRERRAPGCAPPGTRSRDAAGSAAAPDPRVAAVQSALSKAAYGQITADGYVGPQTRDAIVRFEQTTGLRRLAKSRTRSWSS